MTYADAPGIDVKRGHLNMREGRRNRLIAPRLTKYPATRTPNQKALAVRADAVLYVMWQTGMGLVMGLAWPAEEAETKPLALAP